MQAWWTSLTSGSNATAIFGMVSTAVLSDGGSGCMQKVSVAAM